MFSRLSVTALLVSVVALVMPGAYAAPEPGRYVVVLKNSAKPGSAASDHARSHGARVGHIYRHALKGYSARMSQVAAARVANDPRVDYVERDGVAHAFGTQTDATWGLDRIDQRLLPLDKSYTYGTTGAGVTAYVIDTGIRASHPDFTGRVSSGYDFVDDDANSDDCDGHGTHVAGTVGSETYGVAKDVSLVGVRVLDCNGSGYWSDVIAGIDWVTADHDAGEPSVANMSLGGGASSSVDQAVENSIADGVTYAVAAGNGNNGGKAQDACGYSPARTPSALTIGATDSTDTKASWSNYGTCLDLFAPGVKITSTTMNGGTDTWNGTSMATPHVAGVAALFLETNTTADSATVANAIKSGATSGVVSNAGSGSPNLLLYSLLTSSSSPPPSDTTAPGTPSALTAQGGDGRVDLDWADNAETDLAGYEVYRSTDNSTFSKYAEVGAATSSYADTAVVNGTTYYYFVTAFDTSGNVSSASDTASATPQASSTSPSATMHVHDLDGAGTSFKGGKWYATVRIYVFSDNEQPQSDVTVTGTWSVGSGDSCVTGADGSCTVRSDDFHKGSAKEVSFTVTGASHGTLAYDGASNHDPDGDSTGTSIVVQKPN